MHGHIPRPPEDVDVVRVPPIAIEISIGEMQQFTDQIQKRVERQVEEAQPDQMIRYLRKKRTKSKLYFWSGKKNEYKNSFASFNANLNFFMDRCKLIETFFSFFFTSFFTLIRSHSNREIDRFKSVLRYYIIKLVICKKRVRGGEKKWYRGLQWESYVRGWTFISGGEGETISWQMEVTFIFSITAGEMFFTRCIVSSALIFVRSRLCNTRGPYSRRARRYFISFCFVSLPAPGTAR